MFRSSLIPGVIVCLGLAYGAVANTGQDTVESAAVAHQDESTLAADFKSLEQRVAKLERQLAARKEQEQLGRGFLAIDPIVANLDEGRLSRYIRVSAVLVVEDGEKQLALEALSQVNPKVKDWMYDLLSAKTLDDIRGQEGQRKLRIEIQTGINLQLKSAGYPEFAKAVLFDEINVQ